MGGLKLGWLLSTTCLVLRYEFFDQMAKFSLVVLDGVYGVVCPHYLVEKLDVSRRSILDG